MVVKGKKAPPFEEEALVAAICEAARPFNVLALYLFGSRATGTATPLSDIDIAYLPSDGGEDLDKALYLELARRLGTDEITLVNLHDAPVCLAFSVLKRGHVLYGPRRGARAFVERILTHYPEARRLRRLALQAVKTRLEGGIVEVDQDKVWEQLRSLERDLKKLEEKASLPLEEYLASEDAQLVVERKFQTATESCVNIGNHLIAALGLELAEDYASVFRILAKSGVISKELGERMADMARFRNLLVRGYWKIDHEKVYKNMLDRIKTLHLFMHEIVKFLKSESVEGRPRSP